MTKRRLNKHHARAGILLIIYFFLANTFLVYFARHADPLIAFGVPMIFGSISGVLFLYLFSHDDFFSFAKELKKKEMKAERVWLKRFKRFGKITTTFMVAAVGGPILAALTIRLLLSSLRYRYLLLIVTNIPSTFITVNLARGAFSLFG